MKHYLLICNLRNKLFRFAISVVLAMIGCASVASGQTKTIAEESVRSVIRKRVVEEDPTVLKSNVIADDPLVSLGSARLIYVESKSVLVGQAVIESKLRNRPEFQPLGLMITRNAQAADLILELRHDILTKYVFTAVDPRTKVVVASGKLSSLGGTVAGKVAERFLKQLIRARKGN
jgi:hypothetical protein